MRGGARREGERGWDEGWGEKGGRVGAWEGGEEKGVIGMSHAEVACEQLGNLQCNIRIPF